MSLFETVTAADLEPAGFLCEACGREFEVGDEYVSAPLAFSEMTMGDVAARFGAELADGVDPDEPVPVLGEHRCRACFEDGREVAP